MLLKQGKYIVSLFLFVFLTVFIFTYCGNQKEVARNITGVGQFKESILQTIAPSNASDFEGVCVAAGGRVVNSGCYCDSGKQFFNPWVYKCDESGVLPKNPPPEIRGSVCPDGYNIQLNGYQCSIFDTSQPPPKWIQVPNEECNEICDDHVVEYAHCCKRVTEEPDGPAGLPEP